MWPGLEVLRLLAAGKPNQAIAEELVITLHTVKRHVTHILAIRTVVRARAGRRPAHGLHRRRR
jgi:DNA-binding NarL/FixJ family response regulator